MSNKYSNGGYDNGSVMILVSTTDMCDTYNLFDPNYNDRCEDEPIQQKTQGTSCFLLVSNMITHSIPYEWVDIDCVHELRTIIRLSYNSFILMHL